MNMESMDFVYIGQALVIFVKSQLQTKIQSKPITGSYYYTAIDYCIHSGQ